MKSFEYESSSEGDEPTLHPISRTGVDQNQWLKSGPGWGWQGLHHNASGGPSSSNALEPSSYSNFPNLEDSQIPGRRTPLGAVGLGGFYFQGCSPNVVNNGPPSDENNPDQSGPSQNRSPQSRNNQNSQNAPPTKGKSRQGKTVRLNINARERRRMHDLNDALDELRAVIPYAHSPSANALEEMKRLIAYLQGTANTSAIVAPPGFDLQGFPAAAKFLQQQSEARRDEAGHSGPPI